MDFYWVLLKKCLKAFINTFFTKGTPPVIPFIGGEIVDLGNLEIGFLVPYLSLRCVMDKSALFGSLKTRGAMQC